MGTSEESGAGGSQWYGDQAQWYPETATTRSPAPAEEPAAEEPAAEEPSAEDPAAEEPEDEPEDDAQDADRTIDDRDKRAQTATKAAAKVRRTSPNASPPPAVPAQRKTRDAPEEGPAEPQDATGQDDAAPAESQDAARGVSDRAEETVRDDATAPSGWFTPAQQETDPADLTVRDGELHVLPEQDEQPLPGDESARGWWEKGQTVRESPQGGAWPVQEAPGQAEQTVSDKPSRWEATTPDPQDDWNRWSEVRQPAPPPSDQAEQTTAFRPDDMPGFGWQQELQPPVPPHGAAWPGVRQGPAPAIHQTGLWHRLHFPVGAFLVAFGLTNLAGALLRWSRHKHELATLLDATVGGAGSAGGILLGIHVVEILLTLVAGAGLMRKRYIWFLPGLFGWVSGFGAFAVLDVWAGEYGRLAEHAAYFAGFTALLFLAYALGVKAAVARQGRAPAPGAPKRNLTRTQEMALAALSGWQRPGS